MSKKAPSRPKPKPKPTGKRKPQDRTPTPAKGRKKRRTARADSDEEEEDAMSTGEDSDEFVQRAPAGDGARRSTRARGAVVDDDDGDVEMSAAPEIGATGAPEVVDEAQMIVMSAAPSREPSTAVKQEVQEPPLAPTTPPPELEPEPELDIEEEEAKPKPLLRLAYQGFNILGSCLCVVVEPWPPVRAASRAPSVAPIFAGAASRASSIAPASRAPSIAPPEFVRARTPLFLPDDLDRGETPGPFGGYERRVLPPVPLFDAPPDEEPGSDGEDGLMSFSQSLNYAGARGAEDDDEFEGAVFFGDADEARGF